MMDYSIQMLVTSISLLIGTSLIILMGLLCLQLLKKEWLMEQQK